MFLKGSKGLLLNNLKCSLYKSIYIHGQAIFQVFHSTFVYQISDFVLNKLLVRLSTMLSSWHTLPEFFFIFYQTKNTGTYNIKKQKQKQQQRSVILNFEKLKLYNNNAYECKWQLQLCTNEWARELAKQESSSDQLSSHQPHCTYICGCQVGGGAGDVVRSRTPTSLFGKPPTTTTPLADKGDYVSAEHKELRNGYRWISHYACICVKRRAVVSAVELAICGCAQTHALIDIVVIGKVISKIAQSVAELSLYAVCFDCCCCCCFLVFDIDINLTHTHT